MHKIILRYICTPSVSITFYLFGNVFTQKIVIVTVIFSSEKVENSEKRVIPFMYFCFNLYIPVVVYFNPFLILFNLLKDRKIIKKKEKIILYTVEITTLKNTVMVRSRYVQTRTRHGLKVVISNVAKNFLKLCSCSNIVVFLYMILGTFSRDITVRHVPKKDFNSL